MCLRLRLCPKASVYTLEYRGRGGKAQKEKGSDDDKCRGIYLEWSSCDGIAMVQILLTSIFTLSVASANITSPQRAPKEKRHALPATCTLLPPSPPIAFPPLLASQRSSLPKSAKCDEAGMRAETWEWSVEGERAVANGRNSPN